MTNCALAVAPILLSLAGCAPANDAADETGLDAIVAPFLAPEQGGVAIAVIQDGNVVVRLGFGRADPERQIPVTSETVFDLASLGKQFTGIALLMLAQQRKLSMQDDVRKYVPEVPLFDPARPIRIEDLSEHRSGLPEFRREQDPPGEADVLTWLAEQTTLEFPTDARWEYRNINYFILARVVERVSGKPFRAFLEEEVFTPAGMKDAQVLDTPTGTIRNRATGFCFGKPCSFDDGLTGPAGVFASLDDLIAWDLALTRGDLVDFATLVDAVTPGYAVGWRIVSHDGDRAIEHDGDSIGTRTYLVHYLDMPLTIIVLSNQTRFEAEKLERALAERFRVGSRR